MSSLLTRRLALLAEDGHRSLLQRGLRGIEREALRIDAGGHLALTPHPRVLGAALTHPQITTDYSEAMLELITVPEHDTQKMLSQLEALHSFVVSRLGAEALWSHSMPCRLPDEEEIPIAWYGSSHMGMLKHIYRRGLALRYGKAMQCIAGIHYNYSLAEELWQTLKAAEAVPGSAMQFQSSSYVALIRNFRRYGWILLYLFGASPVVSADFPGSSAGSLASLSADTRYLPHATSLRMSDMGYKNDVRAGLTSDFNDLDTYISNLAAALTEPHPKYAQLGTRRKGEMVQLNTNRLQIESEYYCSIRPKRVARSGERPIQALYARGIQYIEARSLDINPFEPLGIELTTCYFLDAFLLFCALEDSPPTGSEEARENTANFSLMAREGRRPGLSLIRRGCEVSVKSCGLELLERIQEVADLFDSKPGERVHTAAVAAQREKFMDADLTPSARVLREVREQNGSFMDFSLSLTAAHHDYLRTRRLTAEETSRFDARVSDSLAEQERAERADQGDFEEFLLDYQAGIPGGFAAEEGSALLQSA